jgi:hypothetical protein
MSLKAGESIRAPVIKATTRTTTITQKYPLERSHTTPTISRPIALTMAIAVTRQSRKRLNSDMISVFILVRVIRYTVL